ncbi:probable cytochrome P450 49a1 [Anabrus simplex]|uniref:probable cytochrome P450 49a1 n=1 Tax=Anabrus simplex TaxID=316456 RepID=UPI0035A3990B
MMIQVVTHLCRKGLNPAGSVLLFNRTRSSMAAAQENLEEIRPYKEVPGPKPLPILGNTWRFFPYIGEFADMDINELMSTVAKKYGKIAKISDLRGINDLVYVFDPKNVETLLRNEGQWPIRPGLRTLPYYRDILRKDVFNGVVGVIASQGKQWQDFRSSVNQTLMQPRSAKQYVRPIDDVTIDLINRMQNLKNANGELPPDFIEHLMRWALESISVVALDTRLGCLDPDLKQDSEPKKMISAVNFMFYAFYELDVKPSLLHFTKRKHWKELVTSLDTIYEVCMKYIRRSMDRIQSKVEKSEYEMSVLETLLIKNKDPMIAAVMAMDMMTAGIDTTSHSSAITLHYLARNQDKQEKLFQELKRVLPSKDEPLTSSKLEEMKYLRACIKESMRISPIVSGTARETQNELVIGNYAIPKGVTVMVPSIYMSNSEEHFSQPDKFIPERWLKGDKLQEKANPFVFLPFGFGPRMCVGRRFAEMEIECLVARVIRAFRIEYEQDLKMKSTVINTVVSPLNFKLEDRS